MENIEMTNLGAVERYEDNEHMRPLISPERASNSSFRNGTGRFEDGTDTNELAAPAPVATKILVDYSKRPAIPLRDLLKDPPISDLELAQPRISRIDEHPQNSRPPIKLFTLQPQRQESPTRNQTLIDDVQTQLDTDLLATIRKKKFEEFVKLLEKGANPNAKNAVHEAAAVQGDYLRLLLKRGAVRNTPDEYGWTPLHTAVWARETANVDLLLNFHFDTNSYEHVEASTSSKKRFDKKTFLDSKIKKWPNGIIDAQFFERSLLKEGSTALHMAAIRIQPECISLLLTAGADPNAKDISGCTPLDVAGIQPFNNDLTDSCQPIFTEVIKKLVKGGSELNMTKVKRKTNLMTMNISPLHVAVKLHALEAIKELIYQGVSEACQNEFGKTALHLCVDEKFEKGLEILAKYAQNDVDSSIEAIDIPDQRGSTVLHEAVDQAWVPGVCIALDAGADITRRAKHGDTPIHRAARGKDTDVFCKILSAAKQRGLLNIKNNKGETPLLIAVAHGREDYVKALLNEGASIKLCLPDLTNVFHIAARRGHLEILSVLFFYNPERETRLMVQEMINERDKTVNGFTPLHFAVNNNHYECAKFLLHVGADVTGRGWSERPYHNATPLHLAAQKNYVEMAKLLIKYDNFQSTRCQQLERLERYRNIDQIDFQGCYPIHTAAHHSSREVIPILLQAGSDLSAKIEEVKEVQSLQRSDRVMKEKFSVHVENDEIFELHLKRNQEINKSVKERKTAMEMLMSNIPKPTEFLEDIFDTYISTNEHDLQNADKVIKLEYSALIPCKIYNQEQEFPYWSDQDWINVRKPTGFLNIFPELEIEFEMKKKMNVINALVKTGNRYGQRRLLVHPLVESFLYLRWKELEPFFYAIFALHFLFMSLLTTFVVTLFHCRDTKKQHPPWFDPWMLFLLYILIFILLSKEILYVNVKRSGYFRNVESCFKIGTIVLAFTVPPALFYKPDAELSRHVATIALLLSWIEIMLQIARIPQCGYYVHMFGNVACNVIKILLTFGFIVVGFSFCFMIQFKSQKPFDGYFGFIVKTMVMMTSEFDYGNLFEYEYNNTKYEYDYFKNTSDFSVEFARLVFVIFTVLVAIVLMNLMIGVSVNDINNLEIEGNLGRLAKQVEFLETLESLLCARILRRKLVRRNIPRILKIYPGLPKSRYMKMLPSHIIEAIFKKCSALIAKKRQLDQEAEKRELANKIDAHYDNIMKTIEKETNKMDAHYDKIMQAIEKETQSLHEVLGNIIQESVEANVKAKESATKIDNLYDKINKMGLKTMKNYRRMSM